MKIPKLYFKNDKGRYEEYKIPEIDLSDTYYRKINGKYEPAGKFISNDIPEGVWVVTRTRSGREYISGKYLRECFRLDKAADIEKFPLSKVGHINKVFDRIQEELRVANTDDRPMSNHELIKTIIGLVYKYNDEA